MSKAEEVTGAIILLVLALFYLLGCGGDRELRDDFVRATAEASYFAQQLDCVNRYDTRRAIDECRQEVRDRWAPRKVNDAGSDVRYAGPPDGMAPERQ